ncbi:Sodium/glucose cotransporter [Crateriforma conspicua]|uniref:Sodium/glucose cotransporter n=2 Tax=Planctomycetaceae TaxID=126 RepID=A0A5C6FUM2_9PLAN|nr:Sodium/glucose cotransporter [Crateriforma conspicua]
MYRTTVPSWFGCVRWAVADNGEIAGQRRRRWATPRADVFATIRRMSAIDIAVLLTYFAVMIAIGAWASRRVRDQEGYFMGGRGFGKLLQTFAAFGAGTGAHEPVTVGRTGWTSGLSGVWSAMMWLFVTPVYWITAVWYRRMRHLTLGDWFVERYDSKLLGAAYTLFAIVFYMFYLSTMLSAVAKFSIPLIGTETIFGLPAAMVLIPSISVVVILYGVLGGLTAAYWTDLLQGIFIILLSVLLIPYGLWQLAERFGGDAPVTLQTGFEILHRRVSADYFQLFAGPSSGEFPIHYILSLTVLSLVGIVVQPHFIATGGGSAKSEMEARVGLVAGNFLKRLCTVGWAMTALIALALLADQVEIAQDPDRVWGVAAREILGPLKFGLVGLMLACLLAAMMSSADTYMIVTSGLVVRNWYAAYVDQDADESRYLLVGRLAGLIMLIGAASIAMTMSDVFGQFKMAIELPILFAAPFWVGMYWRRPGKAAVWGTVAFSTLVFFVLPLLLPAVLPSLRTNESLLAATRRVTTTVIRPATESDVAKRQAWDAAAEQIRSQGAEADSPQIESQLSHLGPAPPVAVLGEDITVTRQRGGRSVYWRGGFESPETLQWQVVDQQTSEGRSTVTERRTAGGRGAGALDLDLWLYEWIGLDLSGASDAFLQTLRLPGRVLMPFMVLMILSLFTPRPPEPQTSRYFAKMNTPVDPDPLADAQRLAAAYSDPDATGGNKLFPGSQWEFVRPSKIDVLGFVASVGICFLVISLLVWLAGLGS